jgi:transposase
MSMPEELFTAALGLQEPWSVQKIDFDPVRGRIDFHISFQRGSHFTCPACSAADQSVHDTKSRSWRHLNFFQFQAYINAAIPRVCCSQCGKTSQVTVPWARPDSGFTLMYEAFTLTLAREMPVNAIARTWGVGDDSLWRIINHHTDKARAREDYSSVSSVGIDETANRRGHDYITIVHDTQKRRVVFACPGRDSQTIESFALHLQAHGGHAERITEACTDMSKAYIKGVSEHLPRAQLSFDPFHVIALANKAVDVVRREEVKAEPELKGSRYLWLKDSSKFSMKQITAFHHLSRSGLKTVNAFRIKESLRDIYALARNADQASVLFARWYSWARRSRLEPIKTLALTLREHLPGILRHFDSTLSNGLAESINSLVQAAKARARGYRTSRNLITMVFLLAGKLTHLPENPMCRRGQLTI